MWQSKMFQPSIAVMQKSDTRVVLHADGKVVMQERSEILRTPILCSNPTTDFVLVALTKLDAKIDTSLQKHPEV